MPKPSILIIRCSNFWITFRILITIAGNKEIFTISKCRSVFFFATNLKRFFTRIKLSDNTILINLKKETVVVVSFIYLRSVPIDISVGTKYVEAWTLDDCDRRPFFITFLMKILWTKTVLAATIQQLRYFFPSKQKILQS